MSKEKTPHANEESKVEPIWTNNKVAEHAAQLYDSYRKIFEEDKAKGTEIILIF